ncbi:alpha/beta fold hydrolase [Roseibium limicola]|uniref:Alpha/beta hydrolase n=1 Tax=Roseibium limicola TaxID=2816037 RepID=A0A939J6K9_9HYPH|nr:alpha/beta hydrolase [Roseibium limicola]MBO0346970.1 alpha/beta hydrolase [Roseibium limicola]
MIWFPITLIGLTLLVAYTFFRTRQIGAGYPPTGTFADVEDVRLHYHWRRAGKVSGEKPPTLVFLHGASGNAWDILTAFEPHIGDAAECLFVDRPGLGHSTRARRHHVPIEQARTLGRLLDQLEIGCCVVVGHSLGASVAAALALERPDLVAGAVFIAPATHPWPGGVALYYQLAAWPLLGPLFSWTLTLPIAERLAPGATAYVFAPDPVPDDYAGKIRLPLLFRPASFRANAADVARLKKNVSKQSCRYGEIMQPCLVFTGDKDAVVWPSIHSDGLERDLPHVRKIVLPGAGHMPHYAHGERIFRETLELAQAQDLAKKKLAREL